MNGFYQQQLKVVCLCCMSLLLTSCFKNSVAQDNTITAEQIEKFKVTVRDYCDKMVFFGSIYITSGEDVVYETNCGPQNIQYDVANTSDSKFRIGSNTKEFAAAILLRTLAGEDLHSKTIRDYLPWYPDNQCADVSLHNLLSMSSGINDYSANPEVFLNWGWRPYLYNDVTNLNGPEGFSNRFCTCKEQDNKPSFEPGSKFDYSNCNYYIIGNILEQLAAGKQGQIDSNFYFRNIVKEQILDPLNMQDSGTFNAIGIVENMTTGYVFDQNQYLPLTTGRPPETGGPAPYENIFKNPYSNPLVLYSAGDMYSTVKDMSKWDQGLYGDTILNEAQKEMAFAPYQNTQSEDECEYFGYGWFVTYIDPNQYGKVPDCPDDPNSTNLNKYEKFLQYSGSYPYSWVTSFSRLLERDQAVMAFSNYNKTGYESDCIAEELRNIIFYNDRHRTEQCQGVLDGTIN
ncbi:MULTISPECIES: serine hydrolase domain-containing protein [Pseudoalteromonas]|uniref:Beta-lactamase n=1 Tax=Pseudoalteromonas luteoviolacea (strain 2ta16) TaxID=1353533 RepID=V4HVD4_PSEL2|nr:MULTISPECIES: serine hydrolase domain-containing protein [Pseudoalteromonas]ESP91894.1 beta-lactamase [Pseudoalteromonas luteoviolacea 2ta16]MCG7549008.1 beta-lactamase family protein [Pseudoalteromonas sp. Of7M-16]